MFGNGSLTYLNLSRGSGLAVDDSLDPVARKRIMERAKGGSVEPANGAAESDLKSGLTKRTQENTPTDGTSKGDKSNERKSGEPTPKLEDTAGGGQASGTRLAALQSHAQPPANRGGANLSRAIRIFELNDRSAKSSGDQAVNGRADGAAANPSPPTPSNTDNGEQRDNFGANQATSAPRNNSRLPVVDRLELQAESLKRKIERNADEKTKANDGAEVSVLVLVRTGPSATTK